MAAPDFKCNHCEYGIEIARYDLYELYDRNEDLQEIECPSCSEAIYVRPVISYSFLVCDELGDELDD